MEDKKCYRCEGNMTLLKDQIMVPYVSLNEEGTKYIQNQRAMLAKVYICDTCNTVEFESIP